MSRVARRLPSVAALSLVTVLVGAGLGAVSSAPRAAAAPTPATPLTSDTVEAIDQPAYPAALVAAGGVPSFHTLTDEGTSIEVYGVSNERGPITEAATDRWQSDQPYPQAPTGFAQASAAALGLLDTDDSVDLAYVAGRQLVVTHSQDAGFTWRASATVPGSAPVVDVAVLDHTPGRFGAAATPGIVLVATSDAVHAYRFDAAGPALTPVTVVGGGSSFGSSVIGTGERVLALTHRSAADRFAVNDRTAPTNTLMYLVGGTTGDRVEVRWAEAGYSPGLGSAAPTLALSSTTVHRDFGSAVQPWTSGELVYDVTEDPDHLGRGSADDLVWMAATRNDAGLVQTLLEDDTRRPQRDRDGTGSGFPTNQVRTLPSTACAGSETPGLDIETLGRDVQWICSNVSPRQGADQLEEWTPGFSDSQPRHVSRTIDGLDVVKAPRPQVQSPCNYFAASYTGRSQALCGANILVSPGGVSSSGVDSLGATHHTYVSAGASASALGTWFVARAPQATTPGMTTKVTQPDVALRVGSGTSAVPAPALALPPVPVSVTIELDDRTAPQRVESKPVPVAFLAAPPSVSGAGQEADPPEFASSRTSGSGTSGSTTTSYGASLGIQFEDPTGAYGAGLTAAFEQSVEDGRSVGRDVTSTEAYVGSSDQDVVVYNAQLLDRYTGTVVDSSTGVALGTPTEVDLPAGGIRSAASVANLQRRFPEVFGPGGLQADVLSSVFTSTIGDPGSYLAWGDDGAAVEEYCDGSLDGGPRELVVPDGLVPRANPFTSAAPPALPAQPDILTSDAHRVLVGTGNSEGASFGIDDSSSTSRVATTSTSVTAEVRFHYVAASASAGRSISEAWETRLGSGVGFSSYVGHIPGQNAFLEDEDYTWRSFLCQKTVPTVAGPSTVWVQGFTVDGYTGSGGLEPLADVEPVSPTGSVVVTEARPTLRFDQATGTVQTYDVDIEAVEAQDQHTVSLSWADPRTSNTSRPDELSVQPERDLLPGQLYRWTVEATDFFGNVVTSEQEFFRTAGAPVSDLQTDRTVVDAGEPVEFRNVPRPGSSPATSYSYDFGPREAVLRTTGTEPVTHVFDEAGRHLVTLTATNGHGSTSSSVTVDVRAVGADDAYTTREDEPLVLPADGVLANDVGGAAAYLARRPTHGTATLGTDGALRYVPDADFCGGDELGYTAGSAVVHSVALTVECLPDAPTVGDVVAATDEDTAVTLDLLGDDTDVDGDRLDVVATPGHGRLVRDGRGWRYVPATNWCGTDTFAKEVTDGTSTVTGTVTVDVGCTDDQAIALPDAASTLEERAVTIDVLGNDVDVDDALLDVALADRPEHGTIRREPDRRITYVPAADACGTDTFTYWATDPRGRLSAIPGTVSVQVACVVDKPLARADRFVRRVEPGGRIGSGKRGLLHNDVDPDGARLRVQLVSGPAAGTLRLRRNGTFTYTAPPSASGRVPRVVQFRYRARNAEKRSRPVTVTLFLDRR